MKWLITVPLVPFFLMGCASPKLPNNQTASDQFYRLGYAEKRVAQNFYELGQGDATRRLYWAQRRSQETGATTSSGPVLQRTYVNIPVEQHREPDGTLIEATTHAVEVVQFVSMTKIGRKHLFIVK